jgi:hypothetical protein
MLNVSKRLQINEIDETEALKLLLLEINKLKKFGLENMSEIGF